MKNIINISQFNEIVTGIKAMKADYVVVEGDRLYGTNNTFSTFKFYNLPCYIPVPAFTIITKELSSKFFSNIIDTNIVIDTDTNKIYCPNHTAYASEANPMIDNSLTHRILSISERFYKDHMECERNPSRMINIGEITDDIAFQRIKEMRAADGAELYIPKGISTYAMYLYSGALPITKSDKVYLYIEDLGNTFISTFSIHKKKLNPVQVNFRFIKII